MSTATDKLAEYLSAEAAVLKGQTVDIDGQRVSLPDLPEIRKGRIEWERRVSAEANQAGGTYGPRHMQASFD